MSIERIKQISIREFLLSKGISPRQENSHRGMYLSPLRDEKTPSFSVDYAHNLWYDHGLGKGGSIIDLVVAMQGCDLASAIKSLEDPSAIALPVFQLRDTTPLPPLIEIQRIQPLSDPRLLYYLRTRGITPAVATRHCREVYYKSESDRLYFAIGFQNDKGGWELRNSRFKISTSPKTITTLRSGSDTVAVFEGFMDYLSYLSLPKERNPHVDAVVLNSVNNLPKAMPALAEHATILTYLDNDEAGRRTTVQIREHAPGSTIIDRAELYGKFNDLNDYLKNQSRSLGTCVSR